MSRWAKIRDCLYPMVSFLLIMVMATMIVTIICAAVTGEYDLNSPKQKAMPLLVNILYYGFSLFYHLSGDPVLYGTGRIEIFKLYEQGCSQIPVFIIVSDLDQGGVSHKFCY